MRAKNSRHWKFQAWEAAARFFSNRWKSLAPLALALVWGAPAWAQDGLTRREETQFKEALATLNLAPSDLGFMKDVAEPRAALGWIRSALHDPMALHRAGAEVWRAARSDEPDAWWDLAGRLLELDRAPDAPPVQGSEADTWEGLDPALAEALSRFMQSARRASGWLDRAMGGLSPDEKSYLAAATLAGAYNAEDEESTRSALTGAGVRAEDVQRVVEEARALDAAPAAARFYELAARVDRTALLEAGHVFQRAVADLFDAARRIETWPPGQMVLVTDLGKVRIGSPGDDAYSDRALLILAPRGHNTYFGAAGAANGLGPQRLAAIIDLDGDDTYRSGDLLAAGSALFGVSVVMDGGGDDVWRAAYAGQGVGLWGVGWVDDFGGQDAYAARALAQGAGVQGLGVLRDRAGRDVYDVGLAGQAYAGPMGLGLLVDSAGNDRYLAGGREPDHERHDDRYLSLAQGFAIGDRPFAGGGVAALVDLEGNDTYVADVYGQGSSYYYSAGLLLDGAGHDRYEVHHYGQGAGIHLSLGLLADLAGDDRYTGGILVQGAAHDFGVGGLLDRKGDDVYVAERDAQGHGMNCALAWLLDSAGDDVYQARDLANSQGIGNFGGERLSDSLGLLLDLGGRDTYACSARDGSRLQRPWLGLVYDAGEPAANERR